jgi:ABC-type transport system involved in multi-copper enzyme maturation permease subunit
MELNKVWIITTREFREALRNKWLAAYAIGFSLLALALSRASLAAAGYSGLGGFGRTTASLINALLLFTPLLGLMVGAAALAGDRERGSLLYLLSQPVSRGEVFWGKVVGAILAASVALALGFGVAALALGASGGGDISAFIGLIGFTFLLMLACLGLGFLISSLARKAAAANGAALVLWLGLAFLGDLGIIGAVLKTNPSPGALLTMLVINPLQVFKLGAIYSLQATLDTLGAAGQYATFHFGERLPLLLGGLLCLWAAGTFSGAFALFNRRQDS